LLIIVLTYVLTMNCVLIVVIKTILITDMKFVVVGQTTANSSQQFCSQTLGIMGTNYPLFENLTPNNEFNIMHSTTKVLSSMRTITNAQISLT